MRSTLRQWLLPVVMTGLFQGVPAKAESWQGVGEMPLDYRAYVHDFNTGDDRGLVEKYFARDTRMISGSGVRKGHLGMNEFLAAAHDG
ncbi:MAG: hypothetical protein EOP08_04145, partial [Proteobacteria bacterium]